MAVCAPLHGQAIEEPAAEADHIDRKERLPSASDLREMLKRLQGAMPRDIIEDMRRIQKLGNEAATSSGCSEASGRGRLPRAGARIVSTYPPQGAPIVLMPTPPTFHLLKARAVSRQDAVHSV